MRRSVSVRSRLIVLVSLIGSVGLASSVIAGPASAAPALKKNYSSDITLKTAPGGVSNTSFTFTIMNQPTSQQTLGSANIQVPAGSSGYTSVSTGTVTAPGIKQGHWFVLQPIVGNLVQLRSDNGYGLAAGESVMVVINATTPCASGLGPYWVTGAKQSNDFSGSGNDFHNVGSDPRVTISPGCAYQLKFIQQPTDTTAGQQITPDITVGVFDSAVPPHPVTTSTASISITLQPVSGSGGLFGTSPKSAVSGTGVATFDDLIIDAQGTYNLLASSSGLQSDTSSSFKITGIAVQCTSSPCTLNTGNLNTGPNKQDDTFGGLSVPVSDCTDVCPFLSIEEDPGSFCDGTCIGSTILFFPPSNATGRITAVGEWDKSILVAKGAAQYNVYKLVGTLATQLGDCSNPDPAPDEGSCVVSRNKTGAGDLVITVSFPGTGDPRWGTN